MHQEQAAWLGLGVLAAVCVGLLAVTLRGRREARRLYESLHDELVDLRSRLDELAREHPAAVTVSDVPTDAEFVITGLGTVPPAAAPRLPPAAPADGMTFADTVLRETVVKAASLAHGVRRGLAPATRNRIRFEMKQEVRRARKQRKSDAKQALRDKQARQRAGLAQEAEAS